MPKTNAEYCRDYRKRKREKREREKKIKNKAKSSTERVREFRARRKGLLNVENDNSNTDNDDFTVHNSERDHNDIPMDISNVQGDALIENDSVNNDSNMQCKSEIVDGIDIEEHNIFENPQLRKIFPDIAKLKREPDEVMADDIDIEEHDMLDNPILEKIFPNVNQIKLEIEQVASAVGSGSSVENSEQTAFPADLMSVCEYITKNIKNETDSQNLNTKLGLEISNKVVDALEEEQIGDYENESVQKEMTCKGCFKQSEEEMCKQCVLESVEQPVLCSSLEGNDDLVWFVAPKNEKLTCKVCCTESDGECKQCVEDPAQCSSLEGNEDIVFHVLPKKETLTCEVCSQESEAEICEQCVVQSVEAPAEDIRDAGENDKKKRPGSIFTCDICTYTSADRSDLERHTFKHNEEKPYSCYLCDFRYLNESELRDHMKAEHSHQITFSCKEYEFESCNLCSYSSAHSTDLRQHIKSKHTNRRDYTCEFCGYKAASLAYLRVHLMIHTGERPYKCDWCGYCCTSMSRLRNHIKAVHTNEKTYSCDHCDYKSVSSSNFNRHMKTHTEKKSHKCELCNYTSAHSSRLSDHVKVKHADVNVYTCDLCEYKCYAKTRLMVHRQTHARETSNDCLETEIKSVQKHTENKISYTYSIIL